ncbi:MAG: hypothetical protein ACI4OJ_12330 [Lachnospiraceae bacterium]
MKDLDENLQNSWHNVRGASREDLEEGKRQALLQYGDIIDLPHHESERHPHLPMELRAAQFAPFAALTGYGDAIRETARRTQKRPELDEDQKEELDRKLNELLAAKDRSVRLTYFIPDERKEGGSIAVRNVTAVRIRTPERVLVLADGSAVPLSDILDLERETNVQGEENPEDTEWM